jgi:putative addiction module component (TIGR02574 family)
MPCLNKRQCPAETRDKECPDNNLQLENKERTMTKLAEKIASEINSLTDIEKLQIVDSILSDLDKTDPAIDHIWAEEARKRWAAYKSGNAPTITYEAVMNKHRNL